MRRKHHETIDRLTKEVMALVEEMNPDTVQWLKAHNKLRRIRLAAMGISIPEKNTQEDITPTKAKNTTQKEMILEYLQLGHALTPLEALRYFGCFRLGARIADIKKEGYNVHSELVHDPKTGKRYASYILITE